jgi:hypothetical protein
VKASRTPSVPASGLPERISAAIAAACGAAADVPKNGAKPGTPVLTPSAAVTSGFWRTMPPVELKSPGVNGVPSAAKNMRRGPSEVKRSGACASWKASGYGPAGSGGSPGSRSNGSGPAAGAAAVLNACAAVECPRTAPGVTLATRPSAESENRPRSAVTWKYFAGPRNRTTASRRPSPPKAGVCNRS